MKEPRSRGALPRFRLGKAYGATGSEADSGRHRSAVMFRKPAVKVVGTTVYYCTHPFLRAFDVATHVKRGVATPVGLASRFSFPGNRIIYLAFIILLTLPVQVYIIPLYVVVVKARLADNLLGLILCYATGSLPLSVFLFKTYFDAIPTELLDAARLDGCSDWLTFTRVVLPLSRPIIATVSIFTFVQAWNEFFLALIFIHNPDRQT